MKNNLLHTNQNRERKETSWIQKICRLATKGGILVESVYTTWLDELTYVTKMKTTSREG